MTTPTDPRLPSSRLIWLREPKLRFAHEQLLDDPKDGLLLFGPPRVPTGFNYGLIGTETGIRQFKTWAERIQRPIYAKDGVRSSVTFPGFEEAYRMPWPASPRVVIPLDEDKINQAIRIADPHQRVFDAVELYASEIIRWMKEEDARPSVWFVLVPEDLWKRCRPKSTVSKGEAVAADFALSHKKALEAIRAPDLFDDYNLAAEKHLYENHFHNQLKAKLLNCEAVTQLVRQTTIAPHEYLNRAGKPLRQLQDDATIAWNLSTTTFYKVGEMPWTLADIRDGVCYIGLVFKKTNNPLDAGEVCCGAQMFLQNGEGLVFKGALGSFGSEKFGEFHLPYEQAKAIVQDCVAAYRRWHNEQDPVELFIHGRTVFGPEEIRGFRDAAPGVKVSGIQIRRPNDLKLFRDGRRPMLRGLALPTSDRSAYLWSSGYVPHLLTYAGREVPSPLRVKVVFGDAPLETVLSDILALTKVNFNSCIYSDGLPVTLRFADDIGEILTAFPNIRAGPLPFRHYI